MTQRGAGPMETVEAFLEAFVAMDFDRALPYLVDDVEYTNIPLLTVRGHAGVREVLEPFFAPIHENEFVILRRAASGPGGLPGVQAGKRCAEFTSAPHLRRTESEVLDATCRGWTRATG